MYGKIIDYKQARDLLTNGVRTKLNRRQAEQLFAEYSILFGKRDGVPEDVAEMLFGECAVKYTIHSDIKEHWLFNCYSIGGGQHGYFTLEGFLALCTYNNIAILEREKSRGQ